MKQLVLFFSLLILHTGFLKAQAPVQFNYQGILRDPSGQPLVNKAVKIKLNLRKGAANGAAGYSETRNVTTNQYGLFTIAIGSPNPEATSGSISLTIFDNGNNFIQTEVDHDNDGVFTDMGTTQLLSVPYAMRALLANPMGNAGGDLGGTYPNPSVDKLKGKPVDLSGLAYHGQVLKWDAINNKWVAGKDEDGGPDYYFRAFRKTETGQQFGSIPDVFLLTGYTPSQAIVTTYTTQLRFPDEGADAYDVFKDSVFIAPENGMYEFEVKMHFNRIMQGSSNEPLSAMQPALNSWSWLGAWKNNEYLGYTIEYYKTTDEAHLKPLVLKVTSYCIAGDKVRFRFTHDSDNPVVLGYAYTMWYAPINRECLIITGRKIR